MALATLIVEDGTLVANANSYAAVGDLQDYADNNGLTLPIDVGQLTVLLYRACAYIETRETEFQGWRVADLAVPVGTQALAWPRGGVYVRGLTTALVGIPPTLIAAQCQLACDVAAGVPLLPTVETTGNIKKLVQGPITTEYFAPNIASNSLPDLTAAQALLAPLLRVAAMSLRTVRV